MNYKTMDVIIYSFLTM